MTSEEFLGWQEYANLEPFGPRQEELRFALLVQAILAASWKSSEVPGLETIAPSLKDVPATSRKSKDLEVKLEHLAKQTGGEVLDG